MAKVEKSEESKEAKEVVEQAEEELKPTEVEETVEEPKPEIAEEDLPETMLCHGTFTKYNKKDMCLTYAGGKYSKEFLKKKKIPCPRKAK